MAQRSPYNDRYKVEQKGKTRRSASAAKPKRAIADITPAEAAKKSGKKTSAWSRAKAASASSSKGSSKGSSGSSGKSIARMAENTPRMKELRRIWWWLWGGAVFMAVGLWLLQDTAKTAGDAAAAAAAALPAATTETVTAAVAKAAEPYGVWLLLGWALWLALMGGAFYLEFMPIRKERAIALAALGGGTKDKGKDKESKSEKGKAASSGEGKAATTGKAKRSRGIDPVADAADMDASVPEPDTSAAEPATKDDE